MVIEKTDIMKRNTFILAPLALLLLLPSCNERENMSDAYGNFEATEVIISAETPGRLLELTVREGDKVSKGGYLASLDTTDLALKRQQLEKQVSATKAKLISLQAQKEVFMQQKTNLGKDLERVKAMKEDGAATQKQLDDIEGAIALAERQAASVESQRTAILRQAEAITLQIREVERNIAKARVTSPIDGTVLTSFAEEGELLAPGKPIVKLADLSVMKLKVYVSGKQLSGISLGQEVEVFTDRDENGLRELRGRVSWISDEAEFTPKIIQTREERVNMVYALEVAVENDGKLKIGMPGEVNFIKSKE